MSPQPSRSQRSNQTESAPRQTSSAQQFEGAVGDDVWLRKMRCTVHQHHELHNACNFVQISDGGLQRGNQRYGDVTCSLFALLYGNVRPQLSGPWFAVLFRDPPRYINDVAGAHKRNESGDITVHDGWLDIRQLDLQGFQAFINC